MNSATALKLSEFCTTGSGGTPSRSKMERYYEGGTIPWIKSGELRESIINGAEEHVTDAALNESSIKLVPAGAILLAMYGATVGRLGILGIEATTNQAVCHIIPDPKIAETRYVYHALSSQVPSLISMGVGGAQPNINQGIIKSLTIPLPGKPEQRRIAAILDQADALRGKRLEALAQLDSLTQSLFIEMFGDPAGENSKHPMLPLESLLEGSFQNGAYYPKESYCHDGGVEMVHMSDAFGGTVTRGKLRRVKCSDADLRKYSLSPADILIARRSLTYEGAAKPCMIPNGEPLIFESSFIRVRPDLRKLTPLFLYHYLNNDRVRDKHVRPYVTQSTISGINQSNLSQVPVMQPPIAEQNIFEKRVIRIDHMRRVQLLALNELKSLFASLQHRAFAGEL